VQLRIEPIANNLTRLQHCSVVCDIPRLTVCILMLDTYSVRRGVPLVALQGGSYCMVRNTYGCPHLGTMWNRNRLASPVMYWPETNQKEVVDWYTQCVRYQSSKGFLTTVRSDFVTAYCPHDPPLSRQQEVVAMALLLCTTDWSFIMLNALNPTMTCPVDFHNERCCGIHESSLSYPTIVRHGVNGSLVHQQHVLLS